MLGDGLSGHVKASFGLHILILVTGRSGRSVKGSNRGLLAYLAGNTSFGVRGRQERSVKRSNRRLTSIFSGECLGRRSVFWGASRCLLALIY